MSPQRTHEYEYQGRIETEQQAFLLRSEMLGYITQEFNGPILEISDDSQRQKLLNAIVSRADAAIAELSG